MAKSFFHVPIHGSVYILSIFCLRTTGTDPCAMCSLCSFNSGSLLCHYFEKEGWNVSNGKHPKRNEKVDGTETKLRWSRDKKEREQRVNGDGTDTEWRRNGDGAETEPRRNRDGWRPRNASDACEISGDGREMLEQHAREGESQIVGEKGRMRQCCTRDRGPDWQLSPAQAVGQQSPHIPHILIGREHSPARSSFCYIFLHLLDLRMAKLLAQFSSQRRQPIPNSSIASCL